MIRVLHFAHTGPGYNGPSFDRLFGHDFGAAAEHYRARPEAWSLVATVDTDDKDLAYQWTNHIVHDWTLNAHAHPANKNGLYRSTMVGDIMVDSAGRRWFVAPAGFAEF